VHRVLLAADHRPEVAYRIAPIDRPLPQVDAPLPGMPRPLWLLDQPVALAERGQRPWWHGPLTLLAGPERIETGWWDGHLVQRDYFVAEGELSGWVWIYRTRNTGGDSGWFLQGVFG
jgi:protein ImuB